MFKYTNIVPQIYHDLLKFNKNFTNFSEKSQRLTLLEAEVQKSHIEVATLRAKYATLDREIMEKDKLYSQANKKCAQLEMVIFIYIFYVKIFYILNFSFKVIITI